ncbi:hypothetical protein GIB67_026175 [Kingdonia uniflora]|uniref:shikimate kinase n=1 Tax=Kingdonia uniflora TaxID=39325 RepID=A0A7J7M357_9MAGN|nr:hypothetical protein GIB67_026175 [Kingdonia uniflora]
MEASSICASSFSNCSWVSKSEKTGKKQSGVFFKFSQEDKKCLNSRDIKVAKARTKISYSYNNNSYNAPSVVYPSLESEKYQASVDEPFILKKKSQDVAPYLDGRCIYLVGMMGSGKTTVGKIISEALGYSFFDSDKLIEQAAGGTSVAQIFKQYSESKFRDYESQVLGELSMMRRLVVATGGGAVIRPINWKYMKHGLTVWLDVPLEALARRIAAVGTDSRPLLHDESGDPYTKALLRLSTLSEERGEAYTNADTRVSLEHIAAKLGVRDISNLTPTAIAIEALVQIENFLKCDNNSMVFARNSQFSHAKNY